eukprot:TRINITY_DN73080_c0_g1_i1.p1 TRINITY_DN73080_c0_g1~~TRINITY_DN73080_c0_g1_i1.p1  ORF type:complete len:117 (+),score=42.06 TRINITY_DN73080_c0_g1_i1:31-351(+)
MADEWDPFGDPADADPSAESASKGYAKVELPTAADAAAARAEEEKLSLEIMQAGWVKAFDNIKAATEEAAAAAGFHGLTGTGLDGDTISFATFKGKVVYAVNVASR